MLRLGASRQSQLITVLAAAALAVTAGCGDRASNPVAVVASTAAKIRGGREAGRLSAPFPYVPRGGGSDSDIMTRRRLYRLAQAIPRTSREDLRAVGVAQLLSGRSSEAIPLLEQVALTSNAADGWSDLAAAHLGAFQRTGRVLELIDALAAADQALAAAPGHPAALFNRATALQGLGLLQDAIEAWEKALSVDSSSRWSDEARVSLRRLRREVPRASAGHEFQRLLETEARHDLLERAVRDHPRVARRACDTLYLARWAAGARAHNAADADHWLGITRDVAAILANSYGEMLLADSVAAIDRAGKGSDRWNATAEGCIRFAAGRRAVVEQRPADAETAFREAAALFERGRSPLAELAHYSVGSTLYAQQRTREAEAMLDGLAASRPETRGYHALAGQIGWERGLSKNVRGAFSAAREVFAAAAAEFEQVHESEAAAAINIFTAEAEDYGGDGERAWQLRIPALRVLSLAGETARKITAVDAAGTAFITRSEWHRAAAVSNIAAASAEQIRDPLRAAHALTDRSIALGYAGDLGVAEQDLGRARRWCAMIRDDSQKRALEERAQFSEAILARDPRASIALLGRALGQLEASGRSVFMVRLRLERARKYRELGDAARTSADLSEASHLLEDQRATLASVEERALLGKTAEALTDEVVVNAFERHAPAAAFDALERWRGRALLDGLEHADGSAGASARPLTLTEISASLAPDAAIVEYALVERRLITFVVRRDRAVYVVRDVDPARVRSVAAAVAAAVRTKEGFRDASLVAAHEMFVAPLADALVGVHVVAFVPDPRLPLPMGALRDARSGETVSDHFATVIAPGSTLAIRCSRAAQQRHGSTMAAVSGDAFDTTAASRLEPLVHAAPEAEAVARLYPHASVLKGRAATSRAVAAAAHAVNLFHFAGHAVTNGARSGESSMLVAPADDHGVMTAAEIAHWELPGARLAFISACRSGIAGEIGDGVENLASAFLVAGVPTVIATAWDVDDGAVSDVAVRFHRAYSAGVPAADALRAATSASHQTQWPPVMIFGGLPELIDGSLFRRPL
jgi:CHAT domain-containing protein/tetratricopeptide (TPR) repeat protein